MSDAVVPQDPAPPSSSEGSKQSSLGELRGRLADLEIQFGRIRASHLDAIEYVANANSAEEQRRIALDAKRDAELDDVADYRRAMRERMPTVREQFAAAAINGLLAAGERRRTDPHDLAREAYAIADGLLIAGGDRRAC